jgi:iron(III) transport system permease protein
MNDPAAATQLASLLLASVALLLLAERRAQRRLRFGAARASQSTEARALPLRGGAALAAWCVCALPVLLGFVLPVLWLLRMGWVHADGTELGAALQRFLPWAWASFRLAGVAALLATALALALGTALRQGGHRPLQAMARTVSLGYAVPGTVIALGMLLPLGWVQQRWPDLGASTLITGTVFGLMYAYLVRFSSVALQSVESGFARVPMSIDETARMLGAAPKRVLLRLHLPLLRRSVLAAALLVFVDVMKELPATLVLRPFGSDTLAVVAYNLARDERLGEAAWPSLAIVAVGLLPVLMLARALRVR